MLGLIEETRVMEIWPKLLRGEHNLLKRGVILVALFFIVTLTVLLLLSRERIPSNVTELNAKVEQYADLFKIYNNDSFHWYNVTIILNQDKDDMSSGFIYEYYNWSNDLDHHVFRAHSFDYISKSNFRSNKGLYFFQDEVKNMLISAYTAKGKYISTNKTGKDLALQKYPNE